MTEHKTALSFADIVEQGNELRKHRDNIDWGLGDLGVIFLDTPEANRNKASISDLAVAWQVGRTSLSAWISNARFYPPECRTFDDLSYGHYEIARRSAGGLSRAISLLQVAQERCYSIRQLERYVQDIWWEGAVPVNSLPVHIAANIPTGVKLAWVTVEKPKEETS